MTAIRTDLITELQIPVGVQSSIDISSQAEVEGPRRSNILPPAEIQALGDLVVPRETTPADLRRHLGENALGRDIYAISNPDPRDTRVFLTTIGKNQATAQSYGGDRRGPVYYGR